MRTLALTLAASLLGGTAYAQNDTLAAYSFNGGLEGWTVTDLSNQQSGDTWAAASGPSDGTFALPAIKSTTGAGGFALFDSDAQCGKSQNSRLQSPVLDFSSTSIVEIRWQQLYRRFASAIFLEASIDGGASFATIELSPELANDEFLGAGTGTADLAKYNLSDLVGGESNVVLAFRYFSEPSVFGAAAGCGYAWMVDDVAIANTLSVAPAADLAVDALTVSTVSNFATPASQPDSIFWSAMVANVGSASQSAQLDVSVARVSSDGERTNLYAASSATSTIAAGQQQTLGGDLPAYALPNVPGRYVASYEATIAAGGVDARIANNRAEFFFEVTDSTFRKTPGVTAFARPRTTSPYSVGNIFALTGDEPTLLDSITFYVEPAGDFAASDATLTVTTYGYLGDTDGDGQLSIGSELVALGTRGIAVGELLIGENGAVRLTPTLDGEPLALGSSYSGFAVLITAPSGDTTQVGNVNLGFYESGRRYNYDATQAAALARGSNRDFAFFRLRTDPLQLGTLDGLVPVIEAKLSTDVLIAVKDVAEEAAVVEFPNPANDYLQLRAPAADIQVASIDVFDQTGRLLLRNPNYNFGEQLDITALPAGLYAVSIEYRKPVSDEVVRDVQLVSVLR